MPSSVAVAVTVIVSDTAAVCAGLPMISGRMLSGGVPPRAEVHLDDTVIRLPLRLKPPLDGSSPAVRREGPGEPLFAPEVRRHDDREDEPLPSRQEVGGLTLVLGARSKEVVRADRHVDQFFVVPVHVPEEQRERPIVVLLPPLVGGRDVLSAPVANLRLRHGGRQHHEQQED